IAGVEDLLAHRREQTPGKGEALLAVEVATDEDEGVLADAAEAQVVVQLLVEEVRQLDDALLGGVDAEALLQHIVAVDLQVVEEGIVAAAGGAANGAVDAFEHVAQADLAAVLLQEYLGVGWLRRPGLGDVVLLDEQLQGRLAVEVDLRDGGPHPQGVATGEYSLELDVLRLQGVVRVKGLQVLAEFELIDLGDTVDHRLQGHALVV